LDDTTGFSQRRFFEQPTKFKWGGWGVVPALGKESVQRKPTRILMKNIKHILIFTLLTLFVSSIHAQPIITAQPANAVIAVGQIGSIGVTATGTGPIAYQWFKNGMRLIGQTNSRLNFASFQFTNSGSYFVVVSNANGLVISCPALVSAPNAPLKVCGYNSYGCAS
jgi:hypothetical protein